MINIYVGAVFFAIDTIYSYQISPSYIQIHQTKETRERERERDPQKNLFFPPVGVLFIEVVGRLLIWVNVWTSNNQFFL